MSKEREYDNWWLKGENGDQEMENSHQEAWQTVIEQIDKEDSIDKTILDFGCNQGGFLRTLYDQLPFQKAVGIDLAKKAIETAKKRVGSYPIDYYQTGDIQSLNQKFDTVISTSVLYLIEDLEEHFKSVANGLNENGVYYATFADQSKNPSVTYMKAQIDQYGATAMQNKSLSNVVDQLIKEGFSVELRKENNHGKYTVTEYKEFYLTVDDYLFSCENSYVIKATKLGAKK